MFSEVDGAWLKARLQRLERSDCGQVEDSNSLRQFPDIHLQPEHVYVLPVNIIKMAMETQLKKQDAGLDLIGLI